ncbi:DUF1054 domain-containing protein [Halalkalibacillus sediminis]|uniref:UPF0637 protein CEY16_01655 n=1 Tax=Halalkalibacillus sediminis TaxID=2018042 RepID=A0A2I0QVZ4_9BACI|nr:DUF1054 domain-containing protein [Halalkalibacillus sediminis]PKR78488.1 DUF1054 domain-containing protein [Halalkalibacillus sediminis]
MGSFTGFAQKDFDVFKIDGLDARMEALKSRISPKLEAIANELQPELTSLTGDEMHVHVAKHLRRTTNPPDDTWAALANNNRGYKKLPHFQIGMWETHVFIMFAVIYESPIKGDFAKQLKQNKSEVLKEIPDNFVWSKDHTKPETIPHQEMKDGEFVRIVDRLENVKKAEILCGVTVDRKDPRLKNKKEFLKLCEDTFKQTSKLYNMTKQLST